MAMIDDYISNPVKAWKKINARDTADYVAEGRQAELAAVADEFVRRAEHNLRLLVQRLRDSGYEFDNPERALEPPPSDADARLDDLDRLAVRCESQGHRGKPLGPVLRAWYRRLGRVDLTGNHPDWPAPLVKDGEELPRSERFISDAFLVRSLDELHEDLNDRLAKGETWGVGFSPDACAKVGLPAGRDYEFDLIGPAPDADCGDLAEGFVLYVREVCKWSGFPGFKHYRNAPKTWLRSLGRDFLPI